MIRARIWGGLGNQMFQYAMVYSLAEKNKTKLALDTSFFYEKHKNIRVTQRNFGLLKFPGIDQSMCVEIKNKSKKIEVLQIPLINYALRKVGNGYVKIGNYILETRYQYHSRLLEETNPNLYLDGYWHCEKYFTNVKDSIISLFSFEDDQILQEYNRISKGRINTIAVHIRRGDYVAQNNPNAMGEEYYRKAIKYIIEQVDDSVVCFFSDDVSWIKETFKDLPNAIIANEKRDLTDVQELQLMRLCRHQIISNSSYSWWGAWLNCSEDKIVIAPLNWKNKADMMPEQWKKM